MPTTFSEVGVHSLLHELQLTAPCRSVAHTRPVCDEQQDELPQSITSVSEVRDFGST